MAKCRIYANNAVTRDMLRDSLLLTQVYIQCDKLVTGC